MFESVVLVSQLPVRHCEEEPIVAFWKTIPAWEIRSEFQRLIKGITRFLLEMLRVEPPVAHLGGWGLSLSMIIGAGLVMAGIVLWFVFPMFGREWLQRGFEPTMDQKSTSGSTVPAVA